MSLSLELLVDGLLALLLLVTIGYAVILNRKLSALRDLRGDMERAVARFAETTQEAERGLSELRERAETLSGELKEQVGSAAGRLEEVRSLNDDLRFLVDKGQALADRLERAVAGGRRLTTPSIAAPPAPAVEPRPTPALRAERPRASATGSPAVPASALAAASAAAPPAAGAASTADSTRRELINALDAIR